MSREGARELVLIVQPEPEHRYGFHCKPVTVNVPIR